MTLLDAQHVSKTFGSVKVLDDVSLTIDAGSVHALLGENGSGKSTLIKILSGFYVPDSGAEISVGGDRLTTGSPPASTTAGLRFVHQNLGLIDEMTVMENLRLTSDLERRALAPTGAAVDRSVVRLLDRIGVELDLHVKVGGLPPVQRAAVAIARAMDDQGGSMRLLVLDEPTAAMSPSEVEGLFAIIRGVKESGASVLYISHRIDEILRLADTATVLRDGQQRGRFSVAAVSRSELINRIIGVELDSQLERRNGPADTAPVCLEVEQISSQYLDGLAFKVCEGEILGVAGLDGSGRDELAGILGGFVPAQVRLTTAAGSASGRLRVRQARELGVGLILPNTHPASAVGEFSVRENFGLLNPGALSVRGFSSRRREQRASERWMDDLDVRPRSAGKKLLEFSGGNRQKVTLAKVLESSPSVLVLDDPTSGVDVGARRSIYDIVTARAKVGNGVVVCSSDTEDLASICDRVLCLAGGQVVAELIGEAITEQAILDHIVVETSIKEGVAG
jgi:ribose transport system ATP-binding protein